MEFYHIYANRCLGCINVSIPNGMEFYDEAHIPSSLVISSFNSQRDGILLDFSPRVVVIALFQFPTGWNSTLIRLRTTTGLGVFQFPTGWNSTLNTAIIETLNRFVSIPNGMEFYPLKPIKRLVKGRFNSQRDRILLCDGTCNFVRNLFQFPTGWNSTSQAHKIGSPCDPFQFPTGWNSTITLPLLKFC